VLGTNTVEFQIDELCDPRLIDLRLSGHFRKNVNAMNTLTSAIRSGLAFFCSCVFVTAIQEPVMRGTVDKSFGGNMQYLTVIGLLMTSVTLVMNQFRKTRWSSNWLNDVTEDFLIVTLVIETFVTLFYWIAYHVDHTLILPPDMNPLPLIIDVNLHCIPGIAIWIELFTTVKDHNPARRHIAFILLFSGLYMMWAEYCYLQNNYYIYPLLGILSKKGKIAFFIGICVVCVSIYLMSIHIHRAWIRFERNRRCKLNPSTQSDNVHSDIKQGIFDPQRHDGD
jgi:uncharacterized membrane protein